MSAGHEIEIKLRVSKPRQFKRRLKELGFWQLASRHLERNWLFDFPDRRLAKRHQALRLRSAAGKHFLTFKGSPAASKKYKIRPEIEMPVSDPQVLRRLLEALQLRVVFQYQKHRTTYGAARKRGDHGLVVYDETPAGCFAELEGPRRWIDGLASALGYSPADYVTTSYVTLYRKARRR